MKSGICLHAGILAVLAIHAAMAQDASTTNALNGFISQIQSVASALETPTSTPATTTSSSESTATSATSSESTATSATATSSSDSMSSTTASTPSSTAAAASSTPDLSTGTRDTIIIICAVIGALLLALLALGLWLCLRRRKKRRLAGTEDARDESGSKPLRADDWYHGNNSHHGYIGAPGSASRTEMIERQSGDKEPRHSVSQLDDDDGDMPDIADHPAFARGSDPYTAAGVGGVAAGGAGAGAGAGVAGAERASRETQRQSARLSTGTRRLSGHMPARKPVGSPPSISSRHRDSNPLRIDTSAAAVGAGVGAATILTRGPNSGTPSEHRYSQRTPRRSSANRRSDPFVSPPAHLGETPTTTPPAQQPEPNATSPLSSHPSNPLLYGQTSNKRNSYRSQKSLDESIYETPVKQATKVKRPPTPLGFKFDFGLPKDTDNHNSDRITNPEAEPLTNDFEPQTKSTHQPQSQPFVSDFESQALHAHAPESQPLTSDIEPQFITAYNPRHRSHSNPQAQRIETQPTSQTPAPVSRYSNTQRHSGISAPTAAQRASLERRSRHFLDYITSPQSTEQHGEPTLPQIEPAGPQLEPTAAAPLIPERSPRRLSRGSFDEPVLPQSAHGNNSPSLASGFVTPGDIAVPPRSPKRVSWNRSRESVGAHAAAQQSQSQSHTQTQSPRDLFRDSGDFVYHSPRSTYDHSNSPRHSPRIGPALGHRSGERARSNTDITNPHGQTGSPYTPTRSQAFGRGLGHSVYGPGDSGAASSVESWVSARAIPVPTPWEDNAIRRNSSSGNLRRPELQNKRSSSSGERIIKQGDSRREEPSPKLDGPNAPGLRNQGQGDSGYYSGYGGYDASWGEGNVEEPVFEKYGAQHSRRKSRDSGGFDPRYGRWTDSTFEENFSDAPGVGEAL